MDVNDLSTNIKKWYKNGNKNDNKNLLHNDDRDENGLLLPAVIENDGSKW